MNSYTLFYCFLFIFVVTPVFSCQLFIYVASAGTYSDVGREDSRNYFESKIFHLPVWHCLQAACGKEQYIIDGNSSLHKLIQFSELLSSAVILFAYFC
jgi:hypothetical protein